MKDKDELTLADAISQDDTIPFLIRLDVLELMSLNSEHTAFTLKKGFFDYQGAIVEAIDYTKNNLAEFLDASRENVINIALFVHNVETMSYDS